MLRLALLALLACHMINAKPALNHTNNQPHNVTATFYWKRLQVSGGFDGRAGGAMYWNPITSKFVLHGVGIYDQDNIAVEELYSAGVNARFSRVIVRKPFDPLYSAISTMDINGLMYRIQGTDDTWNEYPDVWMSSDSGRSWKAQHEQSRAGNLLVGTRVLGAAATLKSNPDTLMVFGGLSTNNDFLDDIWLSTDTGMNWKYAGSNMAFGAIALNSAFSTTLMFGGDETDAVYSVAGTSGSDKFNNDVWVTTGASANIGKKWWKLTSAPWTARGAAYINITDQGIMVVSGGIGSQNTDLNDVWASLDGGYSWGVCAKEAEYSDRVYVYTAMDGDGFLWLTGGRDPSSGERFDDVWKTSMSFTDFTDVALSCNLLVPSCGAGLKCLPTSPNFKSGLWGVTCDACPNPPAPPAMLAQD